MLGAYLLGIVSAVAFGPAEVVLVGSPLWMAYPFVAPMGFVFFLTLLPVEYGFGSPAAHWAIRAVCPLLVILGAVAHLVELPRLRPLRALLLGFPLGFVGTLGIYFGAAMSI
ncbi:MAG: hypothetical protein DWQ36_09150 [Acidobacteria bacterium]|nr:MAG: hypothetical protein DWQ36_09150 [Acidobacteriota bacterium]